MPKAVIQANIQTANGVVSVAPGATVEARNADTGTLVSLWEDRDGESPITNPLTADSNGFFRVYANAGQRVDIIATDNGETARWDNVVLWADSVDSGSLVQSVASVADLRVASFPESVQRLWLSGYYGVGTAGGGSLYRTEESSENGVTTYEDASGVVWRRDIHVFAAYQSPWVGLTGKEEQEAQDMAQTLIDVASSEGRNKVHFQSGVFSVEQLNVPENMRIFGNGIPETRVKFIDGLTFVGTEYGGVFQIEGNGPSDLLDGVEISHLTADGNRDNVSIGDPFNCENFDVKDAINFYLHDVLSINAVGDAVDFDGTTQSSCERVVSINAAGYGIHCSIDSSDITCTDCKSIECGIVNDRGGFDTHPTASGCRFIACSSYGSYRGFVIAGTDNEMVACISDGDINNGIRFTGNNNRCNGGTVRGTTSGNGVTFTDGATRNVLTGGHILGPAGNGINLTSTIRNKIIGVQIQDSGASAITGTLFANVIVGNILGSNASDVIDVHKTTNEVIGNVPNTVNSNAVVSNDGWRYARNGRQITMWREITFDDGDTASFPVTLSNTEYSVAITVVGTPVTGGHSVFNRTTSGVGLRSRDADGLPVNGVTALVTVVGNLAS